MKKKDTKRKKETGRGNTKSKGKTKTERRIEEINKKIIYNDNKKLLLWGTNSYIFSMLPAVIVPVQDLICWFSS